MINKKTLTTTIIAICISFSADAQFGYGLKGGLNISNIKVTDDATSALPGTFSSQMGFNVGILDILSVARLKVPKPTRESLPMLTSDW